MTNDPDIRFATSMIDYVFRRLALEYLPAEKREGLGIKSIAERTEAVQAEVAAKSEQPELERATAVASVIDRVGEADRQGERRAALLQLRLEDAAGGLLLRLLELRLHQRLLVRVRRPDRGRDDPRPTVRGAMPRRRCIGSLCA